MHSSATLSQKIPPRPIEIEPPVPPKRRLKQDDCIKVYCRIRPIGNDEELSSGISVVEGQHTMMLLNEEGSRPISKKYTFTELFKDARQEEVIQKLCDPLLATISSEKGISKVSADDPTAKGGLIFTYGVTNSGKTHTVLGTDEEPGILPYLLQNLPKPFQLLPVEVYNDEFFPLVQPRTRIHQIECSGMLEFRDFDPIQITQDNMDSVLLQIKTNRSQKSTIHNSKSSRSHAIFRIEAKGKVLGVVDLAGSQRVREGCTHEETTNINRSLLTLGRCITCMRQSRFDKTVQIPFRESRLTMALSEYFSLGYRLTMVVNINPAKCMLNETINVLDYAAIAREIKPTTPTKSRYRNINNSHNKMFVMLEETKSDGDLDLSLNLNKKGKQGGSLLQRLQSQNKDIAQAAQAEEAEHLNRLRQYIIKNNVSMLKNEYFERHKIMNSEFNSEFERELKREQEMDDLLLRSIKDSMTASMLKQKLERSQVNANPSAVANVMQAVQTAVVAIKDSPEEKPAEALQKPQQLNQPEQDIPSTKEVSIQVTKINQAQQVVELKHSPKKESDQEQITEKCELPGKIEEPQQPSIEVKESIVATSIVQKASTEQAEQHPAPIQNIDSAVKTRPGFFERIVVSPYRSIKKGVQGIWDRISPAKKKENQQDAEQQVLSKNGKLVSRRSSDKKKEEQKGTSVSKIAGKAASSQNNSIKANVSSQNLDSESKRLDYPTFDDYVPNEKR